VRIVTIANVEMAEAWDGPEGAHWTEHAPRYERTSRRHWTRLVARTTIDGHDAVLDIGCGTGCSTREIARLASSGSVLGVDLSSRMLAHARDAARAEGLENVSFEQADAQVHRFPEGVFDLAVSRFGVMFFADPTAAFANIGQALRPGARLAALAWRELARNAWLLELREALAAGRVLPEPPPRAPGMFGLADAEHVRSVLGTAGFVDVELEEVDEPVEVGADADDGLAFVSTLGMVQGLLQELDPEARSQALDRLHAVIKAHETPDGVLIDSAAWLITARRP
jgi:SAM-dependent methyltransferase